MDKYSAISEISDWHSIIKGSVEIKTKIVSKDPIEKSERKLLNFGHTIGHALETLYNRSGKQISHGFGVAAGMIIESKIAEIRGLLGAKELQSLTNYINKFFDKLTIDEDDISSLLNIMSHDKKNQNESINFTLITEIGKGIINQQASHEEIKSAVEYYLK